jgi:hypothetical protein
VVDLETSVRTLYAQMKQEVELFKTEYMALIEECDKLRQKLNDSQKMHGYMDKQMLKTHEMCEQLRKEASQAKNDASVLKARAEGAVTTLLLLAEQDRPKTQSQKGYLAFNNGEPAPNGGQTLQFLTTGRLSVPDDQQPYQDISPSLLTSTSNLSVSAVTPNQKASFMSRALASSSSPFSFCNGNGSSNDSSALSVTRASGHVSHALHCQLLQ